MKHKQQKFENYRSNYEIIHIKIKEHKPHKRVRLLKEMVIEMFVKRMHW